MNSVKKILKYTFWGVLYTALIAIVTVIVLVIIASLPSPPGRNTATTSPSSSLSFSTVMLDGTPFSEAEISADNGTSISGTDVFEPTTVVVTEQFIPEPSNTVTVEKVSAIEDELQSAIDSISEKYNAAGVQVVIIKNGELVGNSVYGYAIKEKTPMSNDIKIRIASISKVVLAMLIMRLSECDRLDIDTDISDYWNIPIRNSNHESTPITMRQMLSHTSSILTYGYGFSGNGELIRSRFLDGSCFGKSVPGEISSWNYNNYAFAALGITVEIATGETVNKLAVRYLFDPLSIDAAFGSGSISDTDKLATIYTSDGSIGRSIEKQTHTLGSTYPGENGEEFPGGLTISAFDLAKLIMVLINDGEYSGISILSPESVALIESSQGRTGNFEQCLPLRHRTNLYGEGELFYHTGSNFGVYSLISYNPISGDGVVVLTTGASGQTDTNDIYSICGEISEYIYRHM